MRCLLLTLTVLLLGCAGRPQDPRALLTRAQLDQVQQPLLFAELKERKVAATLTQSSQSKEHITWQTGDRVSLTFQNGVVVGSRGIGDDLIAADVENTLSALQGEGHGPYTKFHSYLDGENQTVFKSFQCEITGHVPENVNIIDHIHVTTKVTESCYFVDGSVTNEFWIGQDGMIWRAQQWLSPKAGYLLTERLVR